MNKIVNYKNVCLRRVTVAFVLSCVLLGLCSAQEPFEGEIVYQTYENYSDAFIESKFSLFFNGVHTKRLILKGSKVHLIDETTGCHELYDLDAKTLIEYCDHTKTGLYTILVNSDSVYRAPLSSNIAKKDKTKTILGKNCTLYEGTNARDFGALKFSDYIKAYVADDIIAPSGYKRLYGNQNVVLYFEDKVDRGHDGLGGVGELSLYVEREVTKIIPRTVSDDEFSVPSDCKISNGKKLFPFINIIKV